MAWQGLKLNLRVSQKQILTPGLVQMVSVLALNRLELREMINQEMIANPVLEELSEEPTQTDNYSDENFLKAETEKVPEKPEANPFDEFDVGSFFNQYLDTGGDGGKSQEREVSERPSFEKFLSSPTGLSEHLAWQLSVTICSDTVQELAESIIGNLDENGYLTASVEELLQGGKYSQDDLDDALAVVQDFDPIGVGARDLRECLLLQIKAFDPTNTLAQQIVSDHLKQVQGNQLKEVARALNRPLEVVKRSLDVIRKLDPRPGLRYNKTEPRLVEPDVYFRKVDDQWVAFLNEDDMPQLRLSPTYRRLLVKDASDRDVRNYVKERFTAAIQLMKNIEQRKHTILRVCQSIIARQGEFLDHGQDALKPMMIKEVAEEVGVHPSTVSRAVASKYAHTPQGVLELRSFFSESVNGPEGGAMSLLTLKRVVKKMIEEEDGTKPLTDEQIAKKLDDAGIHVTRRTVAKYREDMRIPSTHQRRLKSFEDMGFYCVDNLPVELMPIFAELHGAGDGDFARAALMIDAREGLQLQKLPPLLKHLRKDHPISLVFIEAQDDALMRRYSETRRPHPLGKNYSVRESLRRERELMAPIRKLADVVIDTTQFNVHELRQFVTERFKNPDKRPLMVSVVSFGYRYGVPTDADLVFDVRFLPNPHFVPRLREFTGKDPKVRRYIRSFPQTGEFLRRVEGLLSYLIPNYAREGKSYLTIAFGCTGGRHRSVMMSEAVKKYLEKRGTTAKVVHRDIEK